MVEFETRYLGALVKRGTREGEKRVGSASPDGERKKHNERSTPSVCRSFDSQLGFEGSMSPLNCLAEPLVLEGESSKIES